MSILTNTTAIIVLSAASFTTLAQTTAEHAQHHATVVAQAQTQPATTQGAMAPKPGAAMPMPAFAAMDERIKEMQAMHEKMVNATTQEERNALMTEHMKTMQDGMTMMNQMGGMGHSGAMGGMGAMGGGAGMQGSKAMPGNMAGRYQAMEKRMDMMQSMMQLMMDRMQVSPAK